MNIRVLATILLIGHLISAVFILLVIVRQFKLFKIQVQPALVGFRVILFILSLGIFFGNFIPILIDALTIFNTIKRSTNHVNAVGISYGISNAFIFALSAMLIWIMYQMAATTVLIVDHDKEEALNEAKTRV